MYDGVEDSEEIRNIILISSKTTAKMFPAGRELLLDERAVLCSKFLLQGSLFRDEGNTQ
jgi:hypothetical protein